MKYSDLPVFEGISEENCLMLMKCFRVAEKRFAAGEVIADYDGKNRSVGIIAEGAVEMVRIDQDGNRTVLEFLVKNDLFGETLAFPAPYDSITVRSVTDTTILFIDFDDITKRCEHACVSHSRMVENMFRLIATKSRALSSRLEVLSGRSIRDKLMSFFRQTAEKSGSNRFRLPFSMTTLADYISADRSATARELKRMRDENVVTVENKFVTIL